MLSASRLVAIVLTFLAPVAGLAGASPESERLTGGPGEAEDEWIQPGVSLDVDSLSVTGNCTANYLFRSTDGTLYLGAADHCFRAFGIGAPVRIGNELTGGVIGSYAFSLADALGYDPDDLHYAEHDFALIAIPAESYSSTSPAVSGYGGPLGVHDGGHAVGDLVLAYGNSAFRPGIHKLGGVVYMTAADFFLFVAMPGLLFGDSGSPVLDPEGNAVGFVTGVDLVVRIDFVLRRMSDAGFPINLLTHDQWNPLPV